MNQPQLTLQWAVAEPEQDQLLRDFLKCKDISKRSLTHIKYDGGKIEVNGVESTVRRKLAKGDEVKITFPVEKRSRTLKGEPIQLDVLYEDDWVLVINKPPYMNTIPSREHPFGSVANAITGKYELQNYPGAVHIATRLDRDTSGIMLVAKHTHAHHLISKMQQGGSVHRFYTAIVHGRINPPEGVICSPIGRKNSSIIEREVREDGQKAITHYKTIISRPDITVVQLKLETGRTHQIRVHLQSIGHPIMGDDLYGGRQELISRQALNCSELNFIHPFTGLPMTFKVPLPEDMHALLS
ncbi:RluA family pseudouridine synthase [Jeotgalibacillus sp. S-D1]|uniref:RluA family pseudouridine synthase n=1 Tax=Jeotgalibacillus sp. S-D1 TaxID=2552189 RepID=UPI0010598FFE|nr:RluA family pseudouridine synthase [Jeotgalibacillus sp. S-D1]TDL35303.1 RluA family pseudouridine synthase [Jeotgalibacillus sp. S-D1]